MSLLHAFQLVTALGCALLGGLFFAFSTFVMTALGRLPPEKGVAAMQSINSAVINAWFGAAFFGTPAACLVVAAFAIVRWSAPGSLWLLAGSALLIAGTFLVTILFNVPLNNELAAVPPDTAEAASVWARYVPEWTRWNHVRTVTGLAAAALIVIGVYLEASATPSA